MGLAHSLDKEQMALLIGAMNETSDALKEIEGRTQAMETYFKGVSTVQRRMSTNAQECLETLESLNKIVNSKSDEANESWKQLRSDADQHASRASQILSSLKFEKISKEAPKDLVPMIVSIVLFMLAMFAFNIAFGQLLSNWQELEDPDGNKSTLQVFLKLATYFHVVLFCIIFLPLLKQFGGKYLASKKIQASQGTATIWTLMNDIVKQPFRTRYNSFAASRRRLLSRNIRGRPTSINEMWRGRSRAPAGDECTFDDETTFPQSFGDSVNVTESPPTVPHRPSALRRITKPISQRISDISKRFSWQTPAAAKPPRSSVPTEPAFPGRLNDTRATAMATCSGPMPVAQKRTLASKESEWASQEETSRQANPTLLSTLLSHKDDAMLPSRENESASPPVHALLAKNEPRSPKLSEIEYPANRSSAKGSVRD